MRDPPGKGKRRTTFRDATPDVGQVRRPEPVRGIAVSCRLTRSAGRRGPTPLAR